MIASWFENLKERIAFWWELHDGFVGIWDDLVSPIRWKWETFVLWRRRRNSELVELDAWREAAYLEDRLKEYPRAIPLLERAVRVYEITGQKTKLREIIQRLRAVDPQSRCLDERGIIGTEDNRRWLL